MKKVFLTLALATAVIAAGAQTTIKANFKKGDTKTYVITETNDMGGQIST